MQFTLSRISTFKDADLLEIIQFLYVNNLQQYTALINKNTLIVSLLFLVQTGSGSLLSGHLSHFVRWSPSDELLPAGEELWATHTDPRLHRGCWRDWQCDDEEEEEEEEEGPGGQCAQGGDRRLLWGRRHVHYRHQLR